MTYSEQLKKLPFRYRVLVQIIVWGIKHRKFLWLLNAGAIWLATHLDIDRETKTWSIKSEPADRPEYFKRYFTDIDNIIKSHPELYKEWDGPKAHTIIDTDQNATEIQ